VPVKAPGQMRKWNCHKLESFSLFLDSFARTTRKAAYCYLELFSGPGVYPCSGMECSLAGSAVRVRQSRAKFNRYLFLTPSRNIAEKLKSTITPSDTANQTEILIGNPNNEKTLRRLLDNVPRSNSALVLIDPGGYRRLSWSILEKLVAYGKNWQDQKMELLIVFPLEMALLRNLMRPECEDSVNRFYGNQQWQEIKRQKQVGKMNAADIKYNLVGLFKDGLHNLGYRYVEDFKPASPTHDPYYHLIYASDKASQIKNIREAWGKPRFLRCELLYGIKT
jgi:three-Cys-motif partner protein